MTADLPVTFTLLGADATVPWLKVTSVSVVPFTADGLLVAADLDRGLDLPGGHVRSDEPDGPATARREAWEETRIRLGDLTPVEVIQSDYFGPDDLTYMIVYTAAVTELAAWTPGDDDSNGRILLPPHDFLARYQAGRKPLMHHLVTTAMTTHGLELPPDAG